jgi:hypothetical protein
LNPELIANSPWQQNILGAQTKPQVKIISTPNNQTLGEIKRLWDRAD